MASGGLQAEARVAGEGSPLSTGGLVVTPPRSTTSIAPRSPLQGDMEVEHFRPSESIGRIFTDGSVMLVKLPSVAMAAGATLKVDDLVGRLAEDRASVREFGVASGCYLRLGPASRW